MLKINLLIPDPRNICLAKIQYIMMKSIFEAAFRVLVVISPLIVSTYYLSSQVDIEKQSSMPFINSSVITVVGTLQRVQWSQASLQDAITQGLPVIFENSPITTEWAAMQNWSIPYLAKTFGKMTLKNVFQHSLKYFGPSYSADRPLASLFSRPVEPLLYNQLDLSASDFFDIFSANGTGIGNKQPGTVFYSGHVNDNINLFAALRNDVRPLSLISLQSEDQPTNTNLWLSPRGAVTHPHYDSYHNLNVQIVGHKQWTLVSPAFSSSLRYFPFTHPCCAQSQLRFDGAPLFDGTRYWFSPTAARDTNEHARVPAWASAPLEAVVADTRPGDVLYIPVGVRTIAAI